jgi:hypothetical protein
MLHGTNCITLTITNLGDRTRWLVTAIPRPVYPLGQCPATHCTGEYVVPEADLHMWAESRPYGGLKHPTRSSSQCRKKPYRSQSNTQKIFVSLLDQVHSCLLVIFIWWQKQGHRPKRFVSCMFSATNSVQINILIIIKPKISDTNEAENLLHSNKNLSQSLLK